jgi:TPR repeat protein
MAEDGDAFAAIQFGKPVQMGEWIAKHISGAAIHFKRAAGQRNATGIAEYGICLCNGGEACQNLQEAAVYFRTAVALNDAEAQYRLGRRLRYCGGVNLGTISFTSRKCSNPPVIPVTHSH